MPRRCLPRKGVSVQRDVPGGGGFCLGEVSIQGCLSEEGYTPCPLTDRQV